MADELAMAAGQLPFVAGEEGIIKAYARFGSKGVWFDGASYSVQKLFIPFRYGEPGRRPGGPLAGLGQSGKSAADVVATVVALPPGIGEFNSAQCDRGFFCPGASGPRHKLTGTTRIRCSSSHHQAGDLWASTGRP